MHKLGYVKRAESIKCSGGSQGYDSIWSLAPDNRLYREVVGTHFYPPMCSKLRRHAGYNYFLVAVWDLVLAGHVSQDRPLEKYLLNEMPNLIKSC